MQIEKMRANSYFYQGISVFLPENSSTNQDTINPSNLFSIIILFV